MIANSPSNAADRPAVGSALLNTLRRQEEHDVHVCSLQETHAAKASFHHAVMELSKHLKFRG